MRPWLGAPALALVSTAAMVGVQLAGVGGALAVAVTLWFLALAPGLSLAPALPRHEQVARVAVVVAISLTADTAVATGLLAAGAYDPTTALVILAAVATVGSALAMITRRVRGGDTFIRRFGAEPARHAPLPVKPFLLEVPGHQPAPAPRPRAPRPL